MMNASTEERWIAWLLLLAFVAVGCGAPPEDDLVARIEDERRTASVPLIQALDEGSSERRARAALAMGRIQSADYVEPLLRATREGEPELREAALFALGQLGLMQESTPPPAAVEGCVAELDHSDPRIVAAALEALGKLATPGVPEIVVPFLDHAQGEVRAAAAMALFRCRFAPLWRGEAEEAPPLPPLAVHALLERLDDEDVVARRMKVYAFSRYAQVEAAAPLTAFVSDEDEWVRLFAVRSIGRAGDPAAFEALLPALADTSAGVVTEAIAAVAVLERADRLDASLAEHASFHVRASLAQALSGAASSESIDTLRGLAADVSPTVRAAAVNALAVRLGEAYAGQVERLLADADWRTRVAAAGAASELGDSRRAMTDLALADDDPRVRVAALATLDAPDDHRAALLAAMHSDDLAVRGTAVSLVSESEEVNDDWLEPLSAAYAASPGVDWIEVREAIVDAVSPIDGAERILREMAGADAAHSVRSKARAALAERGIDLPETNAPSAEPSPWLGKAPADDPVVVFETSKGEIRIRCLAREAPIHVASFLALVADGYYDGLIWHRVVPNFVIQGGDPRGDGWGGAGYTLRDEIHRRRYARGSVGMPKAGKDTGGGQIFITHIPTPHLDGNYTIFGQVEAGLEVVDRIEVGDTIVRASIESTTP